MSIDWSRDMSLQNSEKQDGNEPVDYQETGNENWSEVNFGRRFELYNLKTYRSNCMLLLIAIFKTSEAIC